MPVATVARVPRSSEETRRLILDAAELRFAADGTRGATFADIIDDAGQRNNSAIQYHFGDRIGLIEAITARRVEQMAVHRSALVDALAPDPSMHELVWVIVEPLAAMLDDPGGSAYLQIQAELLAHPARSEMSSMLTEPWLRPGLERVIELLLERMPPGTESDYRIRPVLATTLILHALADRARTMPAGADHAPFVRGLVAATVAVLETEV